MALEMDKEFLDIDEVSQYLGIKRSSLYLKVARREIPFYRFGRLLRFRKTDIDHWTEGLKCEAVEVKQKVRLPVKTQPNGKMDINSVVRKTIAELNDLKYNSESREARPVRSIRKEVSDGAL